MAVVVVVSVVDTDFVVVAHSLVAAALFDSDSSGLVLNDSLNWDFV